MKKKAITIFGAFVLAFFTFGILKSSISQSSTGLIASPPYISESIRSGTTISEDIRITNQRATNEDIYFYSRDVVIDEEGVFNVSESYGPDISSTFEQEGWLTYSPSNFHLDVGENQIVTVTIDIPEDMPTMGYYLELVASTVVPESEEGTVGTAPEIVIPILVNYSGEGEAVYDLDVLSFETDKSWYDFHPVKFETNLKNGGNMHLIPTGEIFVSKDDQFADNLETLQFNPGTKRLFAGAGRSFENVWSDNFIYRDDSGKVHVDFDNLAKLRIGKYHAQLNVAWNDQQRVQFATKTVSFWIIPWQLILILLAIILAIVLSIVLFGKIKKKGGKKKSKKIDFSYGD